MIYAKWAALMVPSFFMAVVGRLLAPVLPFFVRDDGYLPDWLSWFQTPDNPCDGDAGHWERHPGTDAWSTYKRRTAWFWRNVCYGFDIDALGVEVRSTDTLNFEGDRDVGAKPPRSGWQWKQVKRDGKTIAWQLYGVRQYRVWPQRCLRVNLGWKLFDFDDAVSDQTVQWTCMANPLFGTNVDTFIEKGEGND